jgi:hypothetical protein
MTPALSPSGNTERVYLDVTAQSEPDEFWDLCVRNDQITNLKSGGKTAFRDTEIAPIANRSTGKTELSTSTPFPGVSAKLKINATLVKGMPHRPDALPIGRCGHLFLRA